MPESLLIALSVGFLGSMHCIGMCGGLISALTLSGGRVWWQGLLAYQLGRITTYTLLGLIGGLLGMTLKGIAGFHLAQMALMLFAGLLMVAFGLNLAGLIPDPLARFTGRAIGGMGLVQRVQKAAATPSGTNWFTLGMANGLLPCGMVYAAIGLSIASGSLIGAAASMFAFGVGTIPAMMVAPGLIAALAAGRRQWVMRLLGLFVVLLGLLTMVRGSGMMPKQHAGMPHDAPISQTHDAHQKGDID